MQMPLRIAGSQKEKQYRSLNFCNCSTTVLHHAFVFSLQLYYKRISVPKRTDAKQSTRAKNSKVVPSAIRFTVNSVDFHGVSGNNNWRKHHASYIE